MMGAVAALIASAVGAQAQTGGYQGAAGSQASANSCCAPVELYTAPAGSVPATFAEVGAAYRAAYAETLATGRALADMVVVGDAAGLFARLASPATLQRDCPQLGPLLSERAFPYPSPVRTYVAEHQASEGTCKIEIDFAGAPGSARSTRCRSLRAGCCRPTPTPNIEATSFSGCRSPAPGWSPGAGTACR
jgi:hypothetical protein